MDSVTKIFRTKLQIVFAIGHNFTIANGQILATGHTEVEYCVFRLLYVSSDQDSKSNKNRILLLNQGST